MLELLHIENIAVIESADISFRTLQTLDRLFLLISISEYTDICLSLIHI